jgi:hypothetical protein
MKQTHACIKSDSDGRLINNNFNKDTIINCEKEMPPFLHTHSVEILHTDQ